MQQFGVEAAVFLLPDMNSSVVMEKTTNMKDSELRNDGSNDNENIPSYRALRELKRDKLRTGGDNMSNSLSSKGKEITKASCTPAGTAPAESTRRGSENGTATNHDISDVLLSSEDYELRAVGSVSGSLSVGEKCGTSTAIALEAARKEDDEGKKGESDGKTDKPYRVPRRQGEYSGIPEAANPFKS